MTDLTGKVALITGGSKGIGRAIALAYGKLGITVALTYMGDKDSAHDTVLEIESYGRKALAIQADVRNEASIKAMAVTARDAFILHLRGLVAQHQDNLFSHIHARHPNIGWVRGSSGVSASSTNSNGTDLRTFDVTNASSGTNAFFFSPFIFIAPNIQLPACHAGLATLPPMVTEQAIEAHKSTQTAAAIVHAKRCRLNWSMQHHRSGWRKVPRSDRRCHLYQGKACRG
jgi:NAD(P)-dependent dehydrogenase (short-subunit alcohol dehydrogenase family)